MGNTRGNNRGTSGLMESEGYPLGNQPTNGKGHLWSEQSRPNFSEFLATRRIGACIPAATCRKFLLSAYLVSLSENIAVHHVCRQRFRVPKRRDHRVVCPHMMVSPYNPDRLSACKRVPYVNRFSCSCGYCPAVSNGTHPKDLKTI